MRAGPVGEGPEVRLAGRASMWIHEGHPRTLVFGLLGKEMGRYESVSSGEVMQSVTRL